MHRELYEAQFTSWHMWLTTVVKSREARRPKVLFTVIVT